MRLWAQPLQYYQGVVNESTPLIAQQQREELIDKMLIENGKRILQSGSYEVKCDENINETLREME